VVGISRDATFLRASKRRTLPVVLEGFLNRARRMAARLGAYGGRATGETTRRAGLANGRRGD
jgi:hypothetical protein